MPSVLLRVDHWVPAEGVMGRQRQLRRLGIWNLIMDFRGNSNSYLLAQIEIVLIWEVFFFFKGTQAQ